MQEIRAKCECREWMDRRDREESLANLEPPELMERTVLPGHRASEVLPERMDLKDLQDPLESLVLLDQL